MELAREQWREMYRRMLTIRYFEEKVIQLLADGVMPGIAHLYIGEEAVAVGACTALRPDDYIVSTHRGHGHLIAKGGRPERMMAELFGRVDGYCKGKGGSMHIVDLDIGILGAMGIVGAGGPIATGAALSAKLRGTDQVCVCFFGDGASNQGAVHEAANLAGIWKLPLVFVCENNGYAMSTPQSKHQVIRNVADRAAGYGFPGVVVDGNDVLAVYEAAAAAVARARAGEGASLIECKTYRWRGHHEADVGQGSRYRSREEIEQWMARCPIRRFRTLLLANGALTTEEAQQIEEEIRGTIERAVLYGQQSALPTADDARADVYSPAFGHLVG